jgi:hypothetical protein
MTTLEARNPTEAELFQGLAAALTRLGGMCDRTSDAIQAELCDGPNFERAARIIGVKFDDLVDVFQDEMFKRGFIIGRRWKQ